MANKIFYIILALLIIGSIGFTFLRLVVWKDYQIIAEVSCDPKTEYCFYYEPEPCAEGDTKCVPEEAYDYKLISKNAATIYACEQTEEKIGCSEELSCVKDEADCSYTLCDSENLAEGEVCSVPAKEDVNIETPMDTEEEVE